MKLKAIPVSVLFENADELARNLPPTKAVGPTNTFLKRKDNPVTPKNPMFDKLSRFTPAKIDEAPKPLGSDIKTTTIPTPPPRKPINNIPNKS